MAKIPEKYYVGIRSQHPNQESLPLAFATPHGTDKAFEKRKDTVDSWTGKGGRFEVIDNILVEGFRVSQSVKRTGWNGGNVVWRIEDPRGFELEISSGNFANIIDCATVEFGVIKSKCIWGREGAHNILLPENSEPYQEAVKLTDLSKQSVDKSALEPGQFVLMKDDTIHMYVGAFHAYGVDFEAEQTHHRRRSSTSYYHETYYLPVHKLTPKAAPKRHVFVAEAAALSWLANGKQISDLALWAASSTANIAAFQDRKEVVNQADVIAAIYKQRNSVFSVVPSIIDVKPIKKPVFTLVEGATHNSLCLYDVGVNEVMLIGYNNMHQRPYYETNRTHDRFINYTPFDITKLADKTTYVENGSLLEKVAVGHTAKWKPMTLMIAAEGHAARAVAAIRYVHKLDRPLTEQSYKVVPYDSPEYGDTY